MRKWFVRLNVQKAPYWAALRHVTPDELRALAPGLTLGSVQFGDSRVMLSDSKELVKLRTAIIVAHRRELARTGEDVAADASVTA
ncbi:MAG: hypothetical protein DIU78_002325 [Pseudomonadota bacterium]